MPKNKTPLPRESKARGYVKGKGGRGESGVRCPVLNRNSRGGGKMNNTLETTLFMYDLKQ